MKYIVVKRFKSVEEAEEFLSSNNRRHPYGLLTLTSFLLGSFVLSRLSLDNSTKNVLLLIWGVLVFVLLPKLLDKK
ncbi:hypothetical protein [Thermococcus sp.]|uniref:hypothetical protein n=1 Tax=Thermococcus sp. TaxID=35749 RepID=UPI002605011B|nr:hypothetical protein [Thermococcus sp.]